MRRTAGRIHRNAWALPLLAACTAAPQPPVARDAPDAAPEVAPIACAEGDPTQQRHGARCLCCHADEFSVAGSVDPASPPIERIVVVDALGDERVMGPNTFGNFFAHFAMTPPFRATVYASDGRALAMSGSAPHADCNACHARGGPTPPIFGP